MPARPVHSGDTRRVQGAHQNRRQEIDADGRHKGPASPDPLSLRRLRMKLLSIVIPAYNESAYIGTLLQAIAQVDTRPLGFEKEVLVVNDGSTDDTEAIARTFEPGVKCFNQVPNQGKGRAVQRGILEARGDYILVQDADMEYDPADYLPILEALDTG